MLEYLDVGKIVNTHGVKGEVKVIPLTDNPERFNSLEWAFVETGDGLKKYFIERVRFFKGNVLVKFKGIDDMTSAEAFRGLFMKVDREHAVKLPENCWFICDLIDCEVYETSGRLLGILKDVLQTGSNDVYVVVDKQRREILIPALKSVVKEVSPENKKIVVELPEGLL